jgi:secreted PhoX family phosphatase
VSTVEDPNRTSNDLTELVDTLVSRRGVLVGGAAAAALAFFGGPGGLVRGGAAARASVPTSLLTFTPIAASTSDAVLVPPEYGYEVLYRWGDPTTPIGPAFLSDGSNSSTDQGRQAGMGHDGMEFFPLPPAGGAPRGLLCLNHEFAEDFLLFPDGDAAWSREKTRKSQFAHGVSVITLEFDGTSWHQVTSSFNRRITARTPMTFSGPAAGHALLRTSQDPTGLHPLGTANNCAVGKTPWGTFLTCEENFNAYFGSANGAATITPLMQAYGIGTNGFGPDWWRNDTRFDIDTEPNESNRFGWVVEIDPFARRSTPVKRTALGRVKHENALCTESVDGRVVVYTGDDERGQFVYKFVGSQPWQDVVAAGESPLDTGTLYVARFDVGAVAGDKAGTGEWLPLVQGVGPLTPANGFADQGDVLVNTRTAALLVGATRMDRPEWIARNPLTGDLYEAMTNNTQRGTTFPLDEANPRANNRYGHIIRWTEAGGDAGALTFDWDLFVLAGDPANATHEATPGIDAFGSPDGLAIDPDGRIWIETDGSQPISCNNQLLLADPATLDVKRFLVGPAGCEITGIAFTPDRTTVFVNIQHPGEAGTVANPRAQSNWPDFDPAGRPRDAVLAIRRLDGGIVGS